MKHGIKLGILALENSGKTTLIANLTDALVMSTDNKAFRGKVPHFRANHYNGLDSLLETIGEKLELYKEKYGEYPKTFAIDSVTHLQSAMEKWANESFTGFNVWSNLGKDILSFNAFLEDELIPNGINVVFTAHVQYDADTTKYKVQSPGQFGKSGSWLSVVDEAIFIEVKSGKRIAHLKSTKFPCRTHHTELQDNVNIDDFDINTHIGLLEQSNEVAEEWAI